MNKNRKEIRTLETLKKKLRFFEIPLLGNCLVFNFWPAAISGEIDFQDLSLKGPGILLFSEILDIEKKLFGFFICFTCFQNFLSNFPRIS